MNDFPSIHRLVAELYSLNTTVAQEAQYSLQKIGPKALPLVIEAAPRLERAGKPCAIEYLDSVGDPAAAPLLIQFLDDDETVQEWQPARSAGSVPLTPSSVRGGGRSRRQEW